MNFTRRNFMFSSGFMLGGLSPFVIEHLRHTFNIDLGSYADAIPEQIQEDEELLFEIEDNYPSIPMKDLKAYLNKKKS